MAQNETATEDATIYLFTHPEKTNGANPKLTHNGEQQAMRMYMHTINQQPRYFDIKTIPWRIGTGDRHVETAELLGAPLDSLGLVQYSPLAGVPASTESDDTLWLSGRRKIHPKQYHSPVAQFGKWIVEEAIANGSLAVVTSRENIAPFNDDQPGKPGAIYKLTLLPDDEVSISCLNRKWELEQVFVAE